jgi:proline iminopeptidase
MMTSLASVLTSDRLKVDVARQIRVWSGTLRDDKDFEEGIQEILPIYAPPEDPSDTASAKANVVPKKFEGLVATDESSGYHSATVNAAFSVNMPRFDVRHKLKEIKVKRHHSFPIRLCISNFNDRFPRSWSSDATTISLQ